MKKTTLLKLFTIIAFLNIGVLAQANNLGGVRWQLTEINGQKVKNSKAHLELNDSRLAGSAGCNRLFGDFKMSGGSLRFGRIGTTKMFCGGRGVMRLESNFLKALDQTTRYKMNGGNLSLYARNRLVLKFKTDAEENSSVNLEDRKWVLETIKNKPLPKIETAPFINFDRAKMSAGGNTGCNVFGGSYETKGAAIKIFDLISTMRACIEDERMNVEREFKDALQNANRYEIRGGKLNLYRDKNLLLTLRGETK